MLIYDGLHYDPLALEGDGLLEAVRMDRGLTNLRRCQIFCQRQATAVCEIANLAQVPSLVDRQKMDVTSFVVGNSAVVEAAVALAREAQGARQFTDTSRFTLRCLVCQKGLVGQEDAVKHATETGHQNFSEY